MDGINMLKLQLTCGADVFIGNTIKIVVRKIDTANNSVELGFYAPKEVKILRGSLLRNSKKRNGKSGNSMNSSGGDSDPPDFSITDGTAQDT